MKNVLPTICLKKHSNGLQPGCNQIAWRKSIQFKRQNCNFYPLLTTTKKVPGNYDIFTKPTGQTFIQCSIKIHNSSFIMLQNMLSTSGVTNWYRMCCPSSHWRAVSIYISICVTNTSLKYYYLYSKHMHYPFSYQQRTCNFYPTLYTVLDCFSRVQISSMGF